MDFAPYQDTSPETSRALSPPPLEGRRSSSFSPRIRSPPLTSPKHAPTPNPWVAARSSSDAQRQSYGHDGSGYQNTSASNNWGGNDNEADLEAGNTRVGRLNEFETSLPIRLDYEACLAYLLLPPAGGVLLLVVEQKSDYVRFHAWQSSLLFTTMFVLHLLFSWSSFLSWVLFLADLGLIGYLTLRAYRDADTLDRCEVPIIGRIASSILDDE